MKDRKIGFGTVYTMVMTDDSLSVHTKALYSYLKCYAGRTDNCWPGYELIKDELKIAKATIRKGIKELQDSGYLATRRTKHNTYNWLDKKLHGQVLESSSGDHKSSSGDSKSSPGDHKSSRGELEYYQEHDHEYHQYHDHDYKKSGNKPGLGTRFAPDKKTRSHVHGCVYKDHDTVSYFYEEFNITKTELPKFINEFMTDSTSIELNSLNQQEICSLFIHWHQEKYISTETDGGQKFTT